MRSLASIQRILEINPIEGADAIEVCRVLGWQIVIGKAENFKVGDLVVMFEIDSILPDRPEFEFMKKSNMRVKTIKLRGQISQGLLAPLSVLPEGTPIEEDLDVTEILGVERYEPDANNRTGPTCKIGKSAGNFPSFLVKTDETRIQCLQAVLDAFKGSEWLGVSKLDGSSISVYIKDGVVGVCSRNFELKESDEGSQFWDVIKRNKIDEKMKAISEIGEFGLENFAIQAEIIGPGIQGNKYNLKETQVWAFNLYDIDKRSYRGYADMFEVATEAGFNICPVVEGPFVLDHTVDQLVEMATRKSVLNPNTEEEGLVFRPVVEQNFDHKKLHHDRLSFKAINPRFLLKEK